MSIWVDALAVREGRDFLRSVRPNRESDINAPPLGETPPYAFGKNWKKYLDRDFSEERVVEAERSLEGLLGPDALTGKTFLDIGCGSGLFSLAAWRLGASRVISVDVDRDSVECCRELQRGVDQDPNRSWTVLEGSILDDDFVGQLSQAEVVYSWGVLHHTGAMWRAIENAGHLVAPLGMFAIGIYNWQGGRRGTRVWQKLKKWYVMAPRWQARIWEWVYATSSIVYMTLVFRNPITYIRNYKKNRGMSWFRDLSDWLGGYPYEAATAGQVLGFVREKLEFELIYQHISGGHGISEFVFLNQEMHSHLHKPYAFVPPT
jgi:SAM-dependent methyltransferase